jgi:hypothetical protein
MEGPLEGSFLTPSSMQGTEFELMLVTLHATLGTSLLCLPQVFYTAGVLMGTSRQDAILQPKVHPALTPMVDGLSTQAFHTAGAPRG